ncbi:hypothetical protein QL285_026326 [Trifolium repens]|nr:hypothetical protein QL285_026326 [Trifolium repens]
MDGAAMQNGIDLQAKHSWVTLHSLLHSERISYRQNGYIWLGDLLIVEISEERDGNKADQNMVQKNPNRYEWRVPLELIFIGQSSINILRWGFLFVLERLLMSCKFLLDELEMQLLNS